jgi:hypothetical protein
MSSCCSGAKFVYWRMIMLRFWKDVRKCFADMLLGRDNSAAAKPHSLEVGFGWNILGFTCSHTLARAASRTSW